MRDAVVAVFVYRDEVFVIRRQNYLRAFPGYYSFPGGKVDREDEGYHYSQPLLSAFVPERIRALIREVNEELGFDLEQALEQEIVEQIDLLGVAITPEFEHIRFNAHYYKIVLNKRPQFHPDSQEIAWSDWLHKDRFMELYQNGEGLMVVPVMRTARALAGDISTQAISPLNLAYNDDRELAYLEMLRGIGYIPVSSNTLPPAQYTYALIIGDLGEKRYLIDPAPKSEKVLANLLNTLRNHPLDGILITHHHRDHHERAPEIARRLGLPVLCSPITEQRLKGANGEDYLDGLTVISIQEGSFLTYWLGRKVNCHELPGHDDGMIGLAAEDMSWFFVSDLVQPMATVVIPEPEGDMQAYFDTLQRVIDLKPKVLITSHGIPQGGTYLLEKTLAHRVEREQQILQLCQEGLNQDEIINQLYKGVNRRLIPLAQQNIRQHMRKLGMNI